MDKLSQHIKPLLEDFIDDLENDEVVNNDVRVDDKTYSHELTFLVSFRRRVDAEAMCQKMRRMCNIIQSMIEHCSAIGDYDAVIRTIDPKQEKPKVWPENSKHPLVKSIESIDADFYLRELIEAMKEKKLSGSIMFDINIRFDYVSSVLSNRCAFDLVKLISDIRSFLYKFCNGFSQ